MALSSEGYTEESRKLQVKTDRHSKQIRIDILLTTTDDITPKTNCFRSNWFVQLVNNPFTNA